MSRKHEIPTISEAAGVRYLHFGTEWVQGAMWVDQPVELVLEYTAQLIANRRNKPADDLLTDLIAAEEEGDRLSNDELVMMVNAVIIGGTDTTRNQLGCAVSLFAEHPDQWALLAERLGVRVIQISERDHQTSARPRAEGEFVNMRPHKAKKGPKEFDESSDTYDTIDWLLKNVRGHNGRVGLYGISYPGFYTSAGIIGPNDFTLRRYYKDVLPPRMFGATCSYDFDL